MKSKSIYLIGIVLAVLVSATYLMLSEGLILSDHHSSDRALIDNFYRNRGDFNQLVEMMVHDKGLMSVTSERTLPEDLKGLGVSQKRVEDYRFLLGKLGVDEGVSISNDRQNIEFTSSSIGFSTHNSQKGYVYAFAKQEGQLVDSLDEMTEKGVGTGLRRIEGGWYLFFEGY